MLGAPNEISTGEKVRRTFDPIYNHLKLGGQTRCFRSRIMPHLENVARHERFTPETALRLANPFFTRSLHLSSLYIQNFAPAKKRCFSVWEANSGSVLMLFMR